jgi:uncharacterized protein YndB with AHSA1/START domain
MTVEVATKPYAEREVVITRVLGAPRELVFKAWTDPRHVAQWWGPSGFTNPVCEVDARPGGAIRIVMRAPDGTEYPMTGVFREVVAPERLVLTTVCCGDRDGKNTVEGVTTVTFSEHDGRTTLSVRARAAVVAEAAAHFLEGMDAGWTQTIDRLDAYVTAL